KMDSTEISLDAYFLPWNPETRRPRAITNQAVTLDTSEELKKDARWIQRWNAWTNNLHWKNLPTRGIVEFTTPLRLNKKTSCAHEHSGKCDRACRALPS
ncbi:hypothetical protein ACTXT7_016451, partial [Hymenolepis weldensis]